MELDELSNIVCGDCEGQRFLRRDQELDERSAESKWPSATGPDGTSEQTYLSCSRSRSVNFDALSLQKSSFLCGGDHVKCPVANSDLYSS